MIDRLFLAFGLVIHLIAAEITGQKPVVDIDNFLTVDATSGVLTGRPSLWQPNVTQFLGIPYASPPIGDLRFAPPQPLLSREAINTKYFGPACPSHFFQNSNKTVPPWPMEETIRAQLDQFGEYFSEDCLTLNVWTRRGGGRGGEKRAVMVWVHGGGFFKGSAMWSGLRGAKLANDFDVVVVTVQFRLSIFGFPGADFLDEVNPGLLDLRMAVEWVRDNIERFGGDPERITLCGQSSGASMVNEYSMAYAEDAIAHAFVLQSGFGPWDAPRGTRSKEAATQSWYAVSEKMGCGGSAEGEATLGCMRQKSWEEIMEAGMKTYFAPTVDERTWSSNPDELMKKGKFAKKPVLMGNTADEGAYMKFLNDNTDYADYIFHAPHCASVNVAKSRALHGVPVWQYVYAGNYPNQDLGVGGAWHGSEVGMIFGTSEGVSRRPPTPEQSHLSEFMGKAWTEFAKDPYRGLEGMGWPRYDAEDKVPSIIRLGERDSSDIVFEHVRDRTAECSRIGVRSLAKASIFPISTLKTVAGFSVVISPRATQLPQTPYPYDPLPSETLSTNAKYIFQSRAYNKTPYRTESKYRLWDWLIWQDDLLASQCGLYPEHTRCWGAFIVRVSYDNDELFARAVRAIRRIMLARIHEERDAWVARDIEETGHPLEPLPAEKDFSKHPDIGPGKASRLTEMYRDFVRPYIEVQCPRNEPVALADVFAGELLQMHYNMVLEDREALDGADLDSAFLYQAAYLEKRNIYDHAANRGGFFVYLDKESIERLARVPDDEAMAVMTRDEKARLGWETWVKIVSMEGRTDPEDWSDWPVYTGVSREPSALRRLRLPLWFDFLGAVGDRRMEGLGYEGEGYERGPGSAEWTYAPPNHYEFPGKKEQMEALYGPRKHGRY